ncbi:hypothetical protein OS493_013151 [Desmophyllum pertusum]|uniref:Uncharacterized protein n=1 Tax=Desmophyllum pertusum TaxID=174260 RepID=A0A9X0CKR1_9CNID|nr:hypothetical protein OS493_013151 [Desmophyllum pertusum]
MHELSQSIYKETYTCQSTVFLGNFIHRGSEWPQKISLASVLILLALGSTSFGSSEEGVQELDKWNEGYQLEDPDMADNEIIDDMTEVEQGNYEDEESHSETEKTSSQEMWTRCDSLAGGSDESEHEQH